MRLTLDTAVTRASALLLLSLCPALGADEEAAVETRPCSEEDIFAGWPKPKWEHKNEMKRPPPTLKGCSRIILSSAGLSHADTYAVAQAVASGGEACNSTTPCVRQLDAISLDETPVGDSAMQLFADALSPADAPLPFDISLVFAHAEIGAAGAVALAGAIRNQNPQISPSTVVSLDLDWNEKIGNAGARALGGALATNARLRFLSCCRCGIGDVGASRLAIGLRADPPSLSELRLEGNKIGFSGVRDLGTALESNTRLRRLNLSLNPLKAAGAAELARGLKRNAGLEELSLVSCQIGDEGAVALATMLRVNVGLREVDLQGNDIGRNGSLALASALRINPSLRILNLRVNKIGKMAAETLLDAVQNGEAATRGGGGLDSLLLEFNEVIEGLRYEVRGGGYVYGPGEDDVEKIPEEVLEAARQGAPSRGGGGDGAGDGTSSEPPPQPPPPAQGEGEAPVQLCTPGTFGCVFV